MTIVGALYSYCCTKVLVASKSIINLQQVRSFVLEARENTTQAISYQGINRARSQIALPAHDIWQFLVSPNAIIAKEQRRSMSRTFRLEQNKISVHVLVYRMSLTDCCVLRSIQQLLLCTVCQYEYYCCTTVVYDAELLSTKYECTVIIVVLAAGSNVLPSSNMHK